MQSIRVFAKFTAMTKKDDCTSAERARYVVGRGSHYLIYPVLKSTQLPLQSSNCPVYWTRSNDCLKVRFWGCRTWGDSNNLPHHSVTVLVHYCHRHSHSYFPSFMTSISVHDIAMYTIWKLQDWNHFTINSLKCHLKLFRFFCLVEAKFSSLNKGGQYHLSIHRHGEGIRSGG